MSGANERNIMNLEKFTSRALKMSDDVWMRHANPWSGWTRFFSLPLLYGAIWSRKWLKWLAVIPVSLVVIWIGINTRVFKKPPSTDNWMSKVTFGERIMAKREEAPVPGHHLPVLKAARLVSSSGALLSIYGLYGLKGWPTFTGMLLVMLGKTWYMDRMVWVYEDMKDERPQYREWLY